MIEISDDRGNGGRTNKKMLTYVAMATNIIFNYLQIGLVHSVKSHNNILRLL